MSDVFCRYISTSYSYATFHSQELDAKVSISLDMWTSPNGYTFMAIIAHYVNNESKLGKRSSSKLLFY